MRSHFHGLRMLSFVCGSLPASLLLPLWGLAQCPAPRAPLPAVVLVHVSDICLCWRALLRHLVLVHLDPVRPGCSDAHGLLDVRLCRGASCRAPEPGVGGQCPSVPLDVSDPRRPGGRVGLQHLLLASPPHTLPSVWDPCPDWAPRARTEGLVLPAAETRPVPALPLEGRGLR